MKKLVLIVMAVATMVLMVGCSAQSKDKALDVVLELEETAIEIMNAGGMEVINSVDATALGLDESLVKAFVAYQGDEGESNRVYLFELASLDNVDKIKHIGELEQDKNIVDFTSVGGDAFEVAKTSRVLIRGNYVLYLAVPNYEEAKAVFVEKFEK